MSRITNRQKNILNHFIYNTEHRISDIFNNFLSEKVSVATLKRDLTNLIKYGFLELKGEGKNSFYVLTGYGLLHRNIDRNIKDLEINKYNFDLLGLLKNNDLFFEDEINMLNNATEKFILKSKNITDTILKKELERFIIELSWKSSKIEGNTYSLLDTEKLIKDGILSKKNTEEEAVMILNHKKAFSYILEKKDIIHFRELETIHRLIVDGLGINHGIRKSAVGITGSKYLPLDLHFTIEEETRSMIDVLKEKKDFFSKALIAVLFISYLQSFEDGNKRTARLFANGVLINGGYAPLSYRDVDEEEYREAIIDFYEYNSIESFKKIFIKQYIFSCENYNFFTALK